MLRLLFIPESWAMFLLAGLHGNAIQKVSLRPLMSFLRGVFFALRVCEYDRVLKTLYNDYMQLPPENKRVTKHEYEQYWLE